MIPTFLKPRNHIVRNMKTTGRGEHMKEKKRQRQDLANFNEMLREWNQSIRRARNDR